MDTAQLSETLSKTFVFFRKGLLNSKALCEWIRSLGINKDINIGFGKVGFHVGVGTEHEKLLVATGLLHSPDKIGRYKAFGKNALIIPLFDEENQMVNLLAIAPQGGFKDQKILNRNDGIFPVWPNRETKVLLIANDVLSLLKLMSKEQPSEGESFLSLSDGNLSLLHKELIKKLPLLEKIIAPSVLTQLQKQELKDFIISERSEVELTFSDESLKVHSENTEVIKSNSSTHNVDSTFEVINPNLFVLHNEILRLEVLGGLNLISIDRLQLTLKIGLREDPRKCFRDTLNLYQHREKKELCEQASNALLVDAEAVEQTIDDLIYFLEVYRQREMDVVKDIAPIILSDNERKEALGLLQRTDLLQYLHENLLESIGIVGEETNRLITFLVMTSRKLDFPLHMINYGSTGTGKSALVEAIAQCMPEEDYIELTSTSSKAFFHFREYGLQHKLILIQDMYDLNDEVLYQIRELQSKRKLTRTITLKDKDTGFQTVLKTIYGPVCVIASTTADAIYPDNANRSIEITMDESVEQDLRIIERQKQIAAKSIQVQKEENIRHVLKNSQRLLKSYPIMNPFAPFLEIPVITYKKRRTNSLYLGIIETITLLNQYQRNRSTDKQGKEYLIVDIEDIVWANKVIESILLRKSDPLSQAERTFYEELKKHVTNNNLSEFSQQQISKSLRKHPSTVKRNFSSLHQHGYIFICGGDRYKKGYSYGISQEHEYQSIREQIQTVLKESLERAKAQVLDNSKRGISRSVAQ